MFKLFTQIFVSRNQRLIKEMRRTVAAINGFEESVKALRDDQFPEKTRELKAKFTAGTPLIDLAPEAFALAREASQRLVGRPGCGADRSDSRSVLQVVTAAAKALSGHRFNVWKSATLIGAFHVRSAGHLQ